LVAQTCNPSYSGSRDQRINVRSEPRQIVRETLSRKEKKKKGNGTRNQSPEETKVALPGAGGVAQVVVQLEGPEFKPQYFQKTNKTTQTLKRTHIHTHTYTHTHTHTFTLDSQTYYIQK
jgi:hypothetical protein